jgi:hypothetical protein
MDATRDDGLYVPTYMCSLDRNAIMAREYTHGNKTMPLDLSLSRWVRMAFDKTIFQYVHNREDHLSPLYSCQYSRLVRFHRPLGTDCPLFTQVNGSDKLYDMISLLTTARIAFVYI